MKVLQIIDGEQFGGIGKYILDIEKDIKDVEFDYLTSVNVNEKFNYLGISRKNIKGKIIYNHRLKKYLKNNKYDIVHINSGVFLFSFQVALISKLVGVKKIIAHSHSTPNISFIKKVIIKVLNPIFRKITNVHIACSNEAAKSLFTKTNDVIIIRNGIVVDDYKYDKKVRDEYRKILKIDNKRVYGHIGRFDTSKNHEFLIDLFYELQKKEDSILLLIGDGVLEDKIKNKVKELGITNKVKFLGYREDIGSLLCAMDIFLFPSLCEGLGIVVIESETSGLPTFVSNNVSEIANISNSFIKIKDYNINNWITRIDNVKEVDRKQAYKNTIKNGYDIKECSKKLENIYKSC